MNLRLFCMVMVVMIELFLSLHFKKVKKLPLRKSRLFNYFLNAVLICSLITLIIEIYGILSLWHIEWVDMIVVSSYIICYEYLYWVMFVGGITYFGFWNTFIKKRWLYALPFLITVGMVLLSLYNGTVIHYSEGHVYERGKLFASVGVMPTIYVLLLVYYYLKRRKDRDNSEDLNAWFCVIVLYLGLVLDYFFPSTLMLDFFSCICLVMVYVVIEDPRYYRSPVTDTYTSVALIDMFNEYQSDGKELYVSGIKIMNYQMLLKHFGEMYLQTAIKQAANWLHGLYPDAYIFFTNEETLIIVSNTKLDGMELSDAINQRFPEPFKAEEAKIYFWGQAFEVESLDEYKDGKEFLLNLMYSLKNFNDEKQELFVIDQSCIERIKRMSIVRKALTKNLNEDGVEVFFQPLVSTKTRRIVGAEALVRVEDMELGMLMPNEFISIAETTGEIHKLGLLVFDKTCRYVASHDLKKLGLQFVNVNLSPMQFQNRNLVERLKTVADYHNVDFSIFDFEITETGLSNESLIEYQADLFRKYGATISLDDFGTGNSNLQRLTKYPFSVAKLDMSLVWDYFSGKNHVMNDVINMFKDKNLKIVAEGVEDQNMVSGLTELGVDYLQGYYFSKPIPMKEFDLLVERVNVNKKSFGC